MFGLGKNTPEKKAIKAKKKNQQLRKEQGEAIKKDEKYKGSRKYWTKRNKMELNDLTIEIAKKEAGATKNNKTTKKTTYNIGTTQTSSIVSVEPKFTFNKNKKDDDEK